MKNLRIVIIVGIVMVGTGCSRQFWAAFGQGMASQPYSNSTGFARGFERASSQYSATNSYSGSDKLMIFGGLDNKTYLGCLNCSEYATDSVFNQYGTYGSEYSQNSIFNKYSQFGSKYSQYSPCNQYAQNPPITVDNNGTFYGYLTVNNFKSGGISSPEIKKWLLAVCGKE